MRTGITDLPDAHPVGPADVPARYLHKALLATCERRPPEFAELLLMPVDGPKTVRALALIADVVHRAKPSFRDPVACSFALGGKDGWPYRVDRAEYDRATAILEHGIRDAKLGRAEKLEAFRRLERFYRRPARAATG